MWRLLAIAVVVLGLATAGERPMAGAFGAEPSRCTIGHLHISLHRMDGGLDHAGTIIAFRNHGRTCRLRGYPGVDGVHKDGATSVHARRTPEGYLGGPGRVKTVVLNDGEAASAILEGTSGRVDNGGPCHHYAALRISPPNAYHSVIRNTDHSLCYPEVHPVAHGTSGE
jgi:hypothetical protein